MLEEAYFAEDKTVLKGITKKKMTIIKKVIITVNDIFYNFFILLLHIVDIFTCAEV